MIIIFCGVPGAGKTTVVKKLIYKLKKMGTVKVFTSDELKPPVYKKLLKLFLENRGKYDFSVFDATFYKKSHRKNVELLAKGEKVVTVFLDVSLKTALLRNKKRKISIPEQGLRAMFSRMEKPVRPDIYIDTEKVSASSVADMILKHVGQYLKKSGLKKRIFVAIPISEELQKHILDWSKKYNKLAGLPADKQIRWLKGKNLHITLIPPWYSGSIKSEISKIKNLQVKSFEILLTRIQYGPDPKKPRLIWITGEAPKEALILKQKLENKLNQKIELRPWIAHLTIARFQPEEFSSLSVKDLDEKVSWKEKVGSVVLMESHLSPKGADYEIVHRIDLK